MKAETKKKITNTPWAGLIAAAIYFLITIIALKLTGIL